jgi:hypothetical protein
MSGNTDFWRNDLFTRTDLPRPGNNLFGAIRRLTIAQINVDELTILDKSLHLHNVKSPRGSLEIADSREEHGQYGNTSADRRDKTECLVE